MDLLMSPFIVGYEPTRLNQTATSLRSATHLVARYDIVDVDVTTSR